MNTMTSISTAERADATDGVIDRPQQPKPRRRVSVERIAAFAAPIALFAIWELAARQDWVDRRILAPPTEVFRTIWELTFDGGLVRDTRYTLIRTIVGMLAGTIPGTLLGLTMGLFRWPRIVISPLIRMLYPLPRIALFPIILIFVGIGERSNILMIALGPFFTMVITTTAAVVNIDPLYMDVARNFEAGTVDLYRRITIPAALPSIMAGIRVSLGLALLGTTAVEFLIAREGLGNLIWRSWQLLSLSHSVAGLVVTALIGVGLYVVLDRIERRLLVWRG